MLQIRHQEVFAMQSIPYIFISLIGGLCIAAFLTSAVI